ncbi:type II secretion system protein F [Intrasporangium oryzae NRRL B-24470]|uniref:Type II secretion system protein F n=1 Tax=Intrasporangium oryzae NRRL B-24470 TaxID=1386089 RepID=W9G298_9MICO|nr:type II secretion system F family protein [Intrasporangium oryzae]EWT00241.1 type II secretion system protein F [Intrasporangium oryzae NRRL B-24470]
MSPLAIGLVLGAGVFCIYWSCWPQERREDSASSRGGFTAELRDHLHQAGYASITPGNVLVGSVVLFGLVFLLVMLVARVVPIAVCFGVIAGCMPVSIVRMRARQRRNKLRDLWPDAVDNITSGVRAGLALPEALAQLAVRGPEELRPAFAAFAEDYRTSGRFHDCLDRLKDRLSDPVADRLVESLRIAREVGGSDLGKLLRTLSTFLREDSRTRAELETRQSWTVSAARLAVAAPWIVLAMLALKGDSLGAYSSPAGWLVLAIGAGLCVVAYRAMVWIGRLPEEERVLR